MRRLKNIYNSLSIEIKASFFFVISSILQKGLIYIASPIFTRLMTSDEYGYISTYYSIRDIIGTVAMFSLSAGCFDVGMQEFKENRKQFLFSLLVLSNIITFIVALIISLFASKTFLANLGINKVMLIIMFCEFIFLPAYNLWIRGERFEYRYKMPTIISCVVGFLGVLGGIVGVLVFPKKRIIARLSCELIAVILIYVFIWFNLARKSNYKIKLNYVKYAFLFNLPLIPHYLSGLILNSSDRIMITSLDSSKHAGYYNLAYVVGTLIMLVWGAISSSLVPYTMEQFEKEKYYEIQEVYRRILILVLGLCILLMLAAPEIITLLGTQEYRKAIIVIPSIIAGTFFQILYFMFTTVLFYKKETRLVMVASVTAAFCNIVLNYLFITKYGFVAAGYTTMICYLLQATIDYVVSVKVAGIEMISKNYVCSLSVIMIIASFLAILLYRYPVVRVLILLSLLLILFIRRESIKKVIYYK